MTTLSAARPRDLHAPAEVTPGPTATVILPAYNEAEALPTVLSALAGALDDRYEIIVVDDGSTDDTALVAKRFPCRVIRHKFNRGKGAAVQTGLASARGQFIVVSDADATYPAGAIPRIVELLADVDLVRCNRPSHSAHMPVVNQVGNWIFDWLLGVFHGLDGTDHLSGLYGLRREALLHMNLQSTGFDIEAEIGIKARVRGLRVATFPVDYQPRLGAKKLRPWQDGFNILSRIIALVLLYNPTATFILPGLVLMLLAVSGAFLLGRGPVVTPYFGLSIHSFIVMTLGVLASLQLVVFGMAAALYGVEAGYRPPRWLVRLSSRPIRLGAAALGFGLTVLATLEIVRLVIQWAAEGLGLFTETRAVVLASTILVGGLQTLSAALFLSIFAGRLQRLDKALAADSEEA